jgi:mannose-6-phosphate isomerase-like protein (cupin superfamily)
MTLVLTFMNIQKTIDPDSPEYRTLLETVGRYIDLSVTCYCSDVRSLRRIDKREPMYGGDGVVYLLQMFDVGELVNNRIGAYMVFLNKGDQAGFHEHGGRKEQEVYVCLHGQGEYTERQGMDKDGPTRTTTLKKGSITAIKDDGYHSVRNTGEEPLIVFVITTYQ